MRAAQKLASLPECRKHNHLGKLHARRTLGRLTVHRFRALLVLALPLLSLNEKGRAEARWSAGANRGKRASAPSLPFAGAYALAAAILWNVELETLAVPTVGVPLTTVSRDFITMG